jgi:hypothetical protein
MTDLLEDPVPIMCRAAYKQNGFRFFMSRTPKVCSLVDEVSMGIGTVPDDRGEPMNKGLKTII